MAVKTNCYYFYSNFFKKLLVLEPMFYLHTPWKRQKTFVFFKERVNVFMPNILITLGLVKTAQDIALLQKLSYSS